MTTSTWASASAFGVAGSHMCAHVRRTVRAEATRVDLVLEPTEPARQKPLIQRAVGTVALAFPSRPHPLALDGIGLASWGRGARHSPKPESSKARTHRNGGGAFVTSRAKDFVLARSSCQKRREDNAHHQHWNVNPANEYAEGSRNKTDFAGDYLARVTKEDLHSMMVLSWDKGTGVAQTLDGPYPIAVREVDIDARESAGHDYCIGKL